jgi:hypothetical protein
MRRRERYEGGEKKGGKKIVYEIMDYWRGGKDQRGMHHLDHSYSRFSVERAPDFDFIFQKSPLAVDCFPLCLAGRRALCVAGIGVGVGVGRG